MQTANRLRYAFKASALHLGISLVVALIVAALVFKVWYPDGMHHLTGGGALFLILMAVDVVCGPVLTFVLYNPVKSKVKWRIDMGLIALTQLAALSYGMTQMANARPVFLAFEGDRFRIVQAFDIDKSRLNEAQESFQSLPWSGPKLIGVRLAAYTDPDYLASVQISLQGLHPAFRPSRWLSYDDQKQTVLNLLKPLHELGPKNADRTVELSTAIRGIDLPPEQMGYLPLVKDVITDWIIVIDRSTGMPLGYLPFDGW